MPAQNAEGFRCVRQFRAIGLALSVALTRYLQGMLFEVSALDAGVFLMGALVLLAVAAVACYIPARRATGVDPASALRP